LSKAKSSKSEVEKPLNNVTATEQLIKKKSKNISTGEVNECTNRLLKFFTLLNEIDKGIKKKNLNLNKTL